MGFLSSEVNKLTFKVQAGNVIDASSGKYWYESIFPNNPALLANRVLTQFDQIKSYPAANLAAAQAAATAIPSILEDRSTTSIRLTQAVTGENNTWVAYATYSTPSSGILDLWVQPQRVPQTSGVPSGGYEIALYSGNPSSGGVYISTTIGQSGGEVGWVFNYDMGLLFLANDLVSLIQGDPTTYPAGLDFYIRGFRYIGETLADGNISGGGSFSFATSSTIDFSQTGPTYSFYIQQNSITASLLNTGSNGGATAGYALSVDSSGNFVWISSVSGSAGTSGTSGTSGISGTSGTSGSSGTSGTSGISGTSGTSGTSGISGTSGTSGSSGTSGTSGISGTSGTSGSSGTSGVSGTSGTSGTSGISGTSGTSGTSGITTQLELYNSDTIIFVTQSTPNGLSASATIATASITTYLLATASNGGATAGYILSNTGDGNFAWVPQSTGGSIAVADYGTGTTFSNVENIIFRGGVVTTPTSFSPTGTASGVLATGTSPTVTVWIPAPPAAVYASHFNTVDGNTTGTVTRNLSTSTVRISTPTSEGTPFETGGWAGTNQAATTTSTPTFTTGGSVTGFSGTSSGDARIIVDVFKADGTSTFSTYTTPTLYQNATHTNSAGITVTIGSYAIDDSGFPAIYTSKYKATVSVSVNMATIFAAYSLDGGRYSVRIKFITDTATDGGGTYTATSSDVFYDTNPNTPSIGGSTAIVESTNSSNILTKFISGVEYYIAGSQFELTTTGINNLNKNTQGFSGGVTKNFTATGTNYNLPSLNLTAWSNSTGTFSGWLNNYDNTGITFSYTSWSISATPTTYRYRGAGAVASAQPFDPWGNGAASNSSGASVLIDLKSDDSTRLGESFNGESERLVRGSSTFSAWNSTSTLGTSISNQTGSSGPFCDACIVGGYLVRPDKYWLSAGLSTLQPNLTSYKPNKTFGANPNYSSHTQTATYHRRFYTASALNINSFSMAFSGTASGYNDFTAALLASQLKVYVRRILSNAGGNYGPTSAPLSLHGALYDFGSFDDGNSGVDTAGSRIRTSTSGNSVSGTFGLYSANVGFWMELQIVDSAIKIDYINVTLTFDNSTTDSAPVT
jgi:hypothetical protein